MYVYGEAAFPPAYWPPCYVVSSHDGRSPRVHPPTIELANANGTTATAPFFRS